MYIVLRNEDGNNGKKFVSAYMLSRTVKILSCLLFLLLYMLLKPDDAIRFAIAFLVIYFLYAIFEIVVLKKENEAMKSDENNR
jgi:F0F1-type ATP synthase assembly protein I